MSIYSLMFKQGRRPRRKRTFAGAATDRLVASWISTHASADADIRMSLMTMRGRSRTLAQNNEYMRRFVTQCKSNIVGPNGIALRVQARRPDGTLDKQDSDAVEAAWRDNGKPGNFETTGLLSREEAERLIVETAVKDGEILLRKIPGFGGPQGYALQLIEADHLDHDLMMDKFTDTGNRIRMGVEIDEWGRPAAYHLLASHPGDEVWFFNGQLRRRIPAADIIHLFLHIRPHQNRGVPWVHAVMRSLNDVGGYREAAIIAARVGAAKMGFFSSQDGTGFTGDDEDDEGNIITEAEPGTFDQLPDGTKLETWDPQYPHDQFEPFNKAMLRGIAAGLGVSYHGLTQDLEGVNFSSGRLGTQDERDIWMILQAWLIGRLHEPLYPQWLAHKLAALAIVGAGGQPLPLARFDKFNAATFHGRRWASVDPLKDTTSDISLIGARLKSRSEVIRQSGRDPQDVWDDIAREQQTLAELGIAPDQVDGDRLMDIALNSSGDRNA